MFLSVNNAPKLKATQWPGIPYVHHHVMMKSSNLRGDHLMEGQSFNGLSHHYCRGKGSSARKAFCTPMFTY